MSNEQIPAAIDLVGIIKPILQPYLGTFEDGKVAIWVEPPQAPKSGSGVHCFIQRHYSAISNQLYQWQVDLVMHGIRADDPALYEVNLQKFDKAIAAMRIKFPNRREIRQPFREDLPPQFRFLLCLEAAYLKPLFIYS
jgi:hypothetical protein